jgi:Family of unknown function (DUF6328)
MREDNHEKEGERQRYSELLGELRTLILWMQVLFGFLLTVLFSSRFAEVDQAGKVVFTVLRISRIAVDGCGMAWG